MKRCTSIFAVKNTLGQLCFQISSHNLFGSCLVSSFSMHVSTVAFHLHVTTFARIADLSRLVLFSLSDGRLLLLPFAGRMFVNRPLSHVFDAFVFNATAHTFSCSFTLWRFHFCSLFLLRNLFIYFLFLFNFIKTIDLGSAHFRSKTLEIILNQWQAKNKQK